MEEGLCRAASELAMKLGEGTALPHDGFPDRVRKYGWPEEDMGIRNRSFGNISEGCGEGGRTPEEAILNLDSDQLLPTEGHRRDFEDPAFTHVGIAFAPNKGEEYGWAGGYIVVVDFGARKTSNIVNFNDFNQF